MINQKFIFITGGVISGIGKGIIAASLGRLLTQRGHNVTIVKLDPYLNVDPGTMNPNQHGEVFVTEDGAETDLDLGHYERFIGKPLSRVNTVTSGSIYQAVINKERAGDYDGATVQVIPHITDEIKHRIRLAGAKKKADIVIAEVGGTVGDIESLPFLEAIRDLGTEVGPENSCYIHVTLLPYISASDELKTKPTQHSVKELRGLGIQPNFVVCRASNKITEEIKTKITRLCGVQVEHLIVCEDTHDVYLVPDTLQNQGFDCKVLRAIKLGPCLPKHYIPNTKEIVYYAARGKEVNIIIAGKYNNGVGDSYLSVVESLRIAALHSELKVNISFVDPTDITKQVVMQTDGVVVPGGFGQNNIAGKIKAAQLCRETNTPFLGLCLGMQCAVVDWAQNVAGLAGAESEEVNPNAKHKVIHMLAEQRTVASRGGTMRLGNYPCQIKHGTRAHTLYGELLVQERHRHRYEFNNVYRQLFERSGYVVSGTSPNGRLVEMIELRNHPFFIATQFHPEFKSRLDCPHPLFSGFLAATAEAC